MVRFVVRDERAVDVVHHDVLVRQGDFEWIQGRDDKRVDSYSERAERTAYGGGAGGDDNEDAEAREDYHRHDGGCNQLLPPDLFRTVVCLLLDHDEPPRPLRHRADALRAMMCRDSADSI